MTLLCCALIAFGATRLHAQTAVDSVKQTIDKLFQAMKAADGNMMQECFADSAILQTIGRDKTGATVIKTESVSAFTKMISTIAKNSADERITYDVVKTDANLATAWTPYKFYLNGQFSHCGVNSFQLIRINGVWKIQYLIDTRRKQACE